MTKLVTIFGGSGFVGRHIAQRMAKLGWRVRVAVRRPNEALFVKPYGAVGQVEPIFANVRDDASVAAAIAGADAVVSCVSVPVEFGQQTFEAVQRDATARIGRLAAAAGVETLVHVSALGADAESKADYARTKADGEAELIAAFPNAVILRPSIMFGPGDGFFNKMGSMARMMPVLPIFGAESRFQPVYVGDVADAAVKGVTGEAAPGIYELGGPETLTLRALLQEMLDVIGRRRLLLNLPFFVGTFMGGALNAVQMLTLGAFKNTMVTPDQVTMLREDNVVGGDLPGLAELEIDPVAMDAVLAEYLWVYRPSGQYAEIKDSARDLQA